MTGLFIDGYKVMLGEEFRIQLLQENPIFTKNGESTYDIDLDLTDPINAKVYKHCHRVNNNSPIELHRPAVLVVDNQVVLNGTEIILEITDTMVSIQLVSGESELNYLIGGDKMINELDLGNGRYDYDYSAEGGRNPDGWIPEPGFKNKYHFAPLYSINHDTDFNFRDFHLYRENNDEIKASGTGPLVRQPYFYHIVNLILNALGYDVKINSIAENAWQYLYIANGRLTSNYNRMLPAWSVNDFFSEVEKLFNLVLIIERDTRDVYLVQRGPFYESAKKIYVDEVLDEYSNTIDEESRESYAIGNIGYDVPDDEYFKYQNISPLLLDFCQFETFANWEDINADIQSKKKKNIIYTSAESGVQYIAATEGEGSSIIYYPKKVNTFRPIENNPESPNLDISFKIIPAAMREREFFIWLYEGYESRDGPLVRRTKLYKGVVQMPAITTDEYVPYTRDRSSASGGSSTSNNTADNINDIQEAIEDSLESSSEDTSVTDIRLAFFVEEQQINAEKIGGGDTVSVPYEIAFVDNYFDFEQSEEKKVSDIEKATLKLDDLLGMRGYYQEIKPIDTTQEFHFRFSYHGRVEVKSIFVIKNREFVCKETEVEVTEKGFDPIVEGIFYPYG